MPVVESSPGDCSLNLGSIGVPRRCGHASWMLIEATEDGVRPHLREVGFDVEAAVGDLHARGYPNAVFMESVLTGARRFG